MSSQQEAQKGYNDEMHSEADVERVRGSSRERETTFTTLDELREREPSRWSRHRRLLGVVGWGKGGSDFYTVVGSQAVGTM